MKYSIILVCLLTSIASYTQTASSSHIQHQLKKLPVLGSVLYIAAHPDDENTKLLAYLANERRYRTGYISITRGDGGQNLIGSEQGEALGLIRTQELLAARKTDGAEQFFTRANDFGFSKNPEETLHFWNNDSILADMVWVIRNFKPDVIICRFPTTGEGGHGHHTASAIIAEEAFTAAADPKKFPEQLKHTQIWQTKRLFWNTFNFGGNNTTSEDQLKLDIGAYNPLLGFSYGEIASMSRSMHKSQGFGTAMQRGESIEYFKQLKGERVKSDLFEGIETSWSRIPNTQQIQLLIQQIETEFQTLHPEKSVPKLIELIRKIEQLDEKDTYTNYWKQLKLAQIKELIASCAGLWMESFSKEFSYVHDKQVDVTLQLLVRNPCKVKLISIESETKNTELKQNQLFSFPHTTFFNAKIQPFSDPYWLKYPVRDHRFVVSNQLLIGKAENDPTTYETIRVEIEGLELEYHIPTVFKYTDPVRGEVKRPLEILPAATIQLSENVLVFDTKASKELSIIVRANTDELTGKLNVVAPKGWTVTIPNPLIALTKKNSEQLIKITLTPTDKATNGTVEISAEINGKTYNQSITRIEYDHIPYQFFLTKSDVKLSLIDVKKAQTKIAYINGAGDKVAQSLAQIGYDISFLDDEALTKGDLSPYAAIITGIRAYNTNERLAVHHQKLMDYVKNGGNLIVQYNTNNRLAAIKQDIGPFPFEISRTRVTDETAPVTINLPNHPALNHPNKITSADFEGWIQERGVYFVDKKAAEYQALFQMNDKGETPSEGSTLVAPFGKGNFVYTGLAFFRQLPAGVPGAFRLFVNLISLPQNK